MSDVTLSSTPASEHRWRIWLCVAAGVFMATLDTSIVNISLPTIARALHTNLPSTQWVVLAYMFGLACILIPVGRLSDWWGRRNMFVAGLLIFTLGSFLCGVAQHVIVLVMMRLLQAIGAAGILASGPAIITQLFTTDRGKALGLTGTVVSLGSMSGPTLGGWIVEALGWSWIFWINIPIGIVAAVYAWFALQRLENPDVGEFRFDWAGTVYFVVALLSLMTLLTYGLHLPLFHPLIAGMLTLLVLSAWAFFRRETRISFPLIDFRIFKERLYTNACVASFLSFIGITAIFFLVPFFTQVIRHDSPALSGLILILNPLALAIFAPLSGALSDRIGSRNLAVGGMLVSMLGLLDLALLHADSSLFQLTLGLFLVGMGNGLFHAPNNNQMLSSIASHSLGVAGGMLGVVRTLGMMTAVMLVGLTYALYGADLTAIEGFVPAFQSVFMVAALLTLVNAIWIGWYRSHA